MQMQHLSESSQSEAAIEEAVHALSWLHKVAVMHAGTFRHTISAVDDGGV